MKKKTIVIIIIILAVAIVGYNYVFQEHRNIEKEQAEYVVTASSLSDEFSINPAASEQKYLNKTIEVSGAVSNKSHSSVTLNNIIFCQFSTSISAELKDKAQIQIKGRFIGYDDLLEEIKLDQCIIIN